VAQLRGLGAAPTLEHCHAVLSHLLANNGLESVIELQLLMRQHGVAFTSAMYADTIAAALRARRAQLALDLLSELDVRQLGKLFCDFQIEALIVAEHFGGAVRLLRSAAVDSTLERLDQWARMLLQRALASPRVSVADLRAMLDELHEGAIELPHGYCRTLMIGLARRATLPHRQALPPAAGNAASEPTALLTPYRYDASCDAGASWEPRHVAHLIAHIWQRHLAHTEAPQDAPPPAPAPPDAELLRRLLHSNADVGMRLLYQPVARAHELSDEAVATVVYVCGRYDARLARYVMQHFGELFGAWRRPSLACYRLAIGIGMRADDSKHVWELLQHMCADGHPPDKDVVNAVIRTYATCLDLKSATEALELVRANRQPPHDQRIYTSIFAMCQKLRDADRAFELFHAMCAEGVALSDLSAMLLLRTLSTAGRIHDVLLVLRHMVHDGMKLHAGTYYWIATCFCKLGQIDSAMSFVTQVLEYAPIEAERELLFQPMLAWLSKHGDVAAVQRLLAAMERQFDTPPTTRSYNYTLVAHKHAGHLEAALTTLDTMRANSTTKPDVMSYNLLLELYCRNNQLDAAWRTIEHTMKAENVKPDDTTLRVLLTHYARYNQLSRAFETIRRLGNQQPSEEALHPIIEAYAKRLNLSAAHALLELLLDSGSKPLTSSYNAVMAAHLRQAEPHLALQLYQKAVEHGIVADVKTRTLLRRANAAIGHSSDSHPPAHAAEESSSHETDETESDIEG